MIRSTSVAPPVVPGDPAGALPPEIAGDAMQWASAGEAGRTSCFNITRLLLRTLDRRFRAARSAVARVPMRTMFSCVNSRKPRADRRRALRAEIAWRLRSDLT